MDGRFKAVPTPYRRMRPITSKSIPYQAVLSGNPSSSTVSHKFDTVNHALFNPRGLLMTDGRVLVDANEAGKGQLEISVNEGRVPNNVQMQGAGRCLVTFIPNDPGTYVVEVTFNGELVRGKS